jgi:uncharacterized protein YlxW (UPF0749 family)
MDKNFCPIHYSAMLPKASFTIAAVLALVLSVWIVFQTFSNSSLQQAIQLKQEEIQVAQNEIQSLQQQLQAQQQSVEAASQLANQAGPAILNELASLQVKNNNIALAVFLQKHGVEIRNNTAQPPAPQPAKPGKPAKGAN